MMSKTPIKLNESHKILSQGTYGWKKQEGSSYPDAYYGYNIPLENKFFEEYLNKKNIKMTHPLASGYAFSSSYAPAGGVTETDMLQRYDLLRGCHPQLPARQNKTSYILDSNNESHLCPYREDVHKETIPVVDEVKVVDQVQVNDITKTAETRITKEEIAKMDENLRMLSKETPIQQPITTTRVLIQNENKSIWLALGILIFLGFFYTRRP